jgi:hypothetical protein
MDMITEAPLGAQHEATRQAQAAVNAAVASGRAAARSGEYLTFRLGGEEYGIDSGFITGIGSIQCGRAQDDSARSTECVLILTGIEGLMSAADMRLMDVH